MGNHKAEIIQEVHAVRYKFGNKSFWNDYKDIYRDREFIKNETLWSGELDSPILQKGDKIHVDELSETFTVDEITRSTSGKYLYLVEEKQEIEDDKTPLSETEAETHKSEYEEKKRELLEKRQEEINENIVIEKKFWWKRLFGK